MGETTMEPLPRIDDGFYTIVYPCGAERTLLFFTGTDGFFRGKQMVGCQDAHSYRMVGHIEDGDVKFWKKSGWLDEPATMARFRKAVRTVAGRQDEASALYALRSGNCCKCGKMLTRADSIHKSMGPVCAKKYVRRMRDGGLNSGRLAA
jgi:hypothetical protein